MRIARYRLLIIGALALVLVGGYVLWAKRYTPPTSDLEVQAELIWKAEVKQYDLHMEFSPDGKVLAYRDDDRHIRILKPFSRGEGSISLLDVDTLVPGEEKIHFVVPDEGWTGYDFQFTGDGLLAAKSKGEICFHDIRTRQVRKRIPDPGGNALTISPKGDMIAFFETQKEVVPKYPLFIRSIDTAETIRVFLPVLSGPVVFSPCGRYVACRGGRSIQVGDMHTKRRLYALEGVPRTRFAFSPDSRYLAAVYEPAGHDRADEVRIWDMSSGEMTAIGVSWRDAGYPSVVAFSPDGRLIASGGTDSSDREKDHGQGVSMTIVGTIRLSDARTGALLWSLDLKRLPDGPLRGVPHTLAFSPDGKMLAVGLADLPSSRVILLKIDVKEKAEE